jgi:hypothetical protein
LGPLFKVSWVHVNMWTVIESPLTPGVILGLGKKAKSKPHKAITDALQLITVCV